MVDVFFPLVAITSNHLITFWRTANAVAKHAKRQDTLKNWLQRTQINIMNKGKIRSSYTENNTPLVTISVLHVRCTEQPK